VLEEALTKLYGGAGAEQQVRYAAAVAAFGQHFGSAGELYVFRTPGRVNLIGEHTDYNHGFVLPAALDKDILLLARPRPDHQVRIANLEAEFAPFAFPMSAEISSAVSGDWSNYARGAAQAITRQLGRPAPGFDGLVVGAPPYGVPRGAGLSSSSALTVVVAVALAHLAGWQPPASQLAHLCSDAEWYVGTRGGMMDQFAALLGQRDHALFLDCRPDPAGNYTFAPVPLPTTHRLLVADSGVHHRNVRGEFNQRVAACRAGVGLLRQPYPGITHLRDVQGVAWELLESELPEQSTPDELAARQITLGEIPGLAGDALLHVRACCRHVWSENQRVERALVAMRSNDLTTLGQLLNAAHASARDNYRISCPELEVLVQGAQAVDGCLGARLTGAGWGGCIVALVHQDAVADFQQQVAHHYQQTTGRTTAIFPCQAGPGAGLVAVLAQ
jgi:galactokinase